MGCNGMPSSFFPPKYLYQMQLSPIEENHHLLPTMPQDFRGVASILGKRSGMTFDDMGGEDELSDDSQAAEKKRRLNLEQVRTLEKNFEIGNKLDPERKMQLARALGMQPRQIAIWFQNRRARWKTKKLENDYEGLKRQFDIVKAENNALHEHNKKLQTELFALKGRETIEPINLNKETEGSSSNRTENSSDINLEISRMQHATDSPGHGNVNQGIAFFPSYKQQAMTQLIQNSMKNEHGYATTVEENLCNIYGGMDDQSSAFWAWSEQHNFH